MRRLLSGGLILLAGAAALSPHQVHRGVGTPSGDMRYQMLHSFFQKFNCPADAYTSEFLKAADIYNLDWRLLPSISFVETAGGKVSPNNNIFGWDNGRARFRSLAAGIYAVGYQLAYSDVYRNKGLDEVLTVYNPVGRYARAVENVMDQIAPLQ